MKITARNQWKGVVRSITKGAVNCEVVLELAGGESVVSIVTQTAVEALGLREGSEAIAIVKASSVLLGVEE